MRKTIFKLFGITLAFSLGLSSCSNSTPTYSNLLLSTDSIVVDTDGVVNVNLLSGNGEYFLQSNNKDIATAEIDGDVIKITGISQGSTNIVVKDWAKKTAYLNVLVNYIPTDELILNRTSGNIDIEKSTVFTVFQGNANSYKDYLLTSEDPSVAIAESVDDGIKVTGIGVGKTQIVVTDKKGLKANFSINVRAKLLPLEIDVKPDGAFYFNYLEGEAVINILNGNGDYSIEIPTNSGITHELKDNQIVLKGTKEVSSTLTLTDARDESIKVPLLSIGDYKSNKATRAFYNRSFVSARYSSGVTDSATTGRSTIKTSSNASLNRGEVLSFSGDLKTVGPKPNPKFHVAGWFGVITEYEASDCEIVKVDGKTIWVTFLCKGELAYMVVNI